MTDQRIMENLLMTTKGVCDLHMHGAIESATPNVHQAFGEALSDNLAMQADLYQMMSAKGWYTAEQANAQQITQVQQKYAMN